MNRAVEAFNDITNVVFRVAVMLFAIWLGVLAADRGNPWTFTPLYVDPPITGPGSPVLIHYTVRRDRICFSRSESVMFDGAGVATMFEPTKWRVVSDMIGEERLTVPRMVPSSASPGKSRYRMTVYYQCPGNPFHLIWPIVDVLDDVVFEIVAQEKRPG